LTEGAFILCLLYVPKKPNAKTEQSEWHLEAVNQQQARLSSVLHTGSIEPGRTIAQFGIR
jgi:hypothetical protein